VHMSLGPSCPICPFSMESGGTKINTQVWRALAPEDVARQEAHRVCSEWLRHGGEGDGWWETRSSRARGSSTRRSRPPGTSASADQNIKHLFQVSLKGQGKESLPAHPWLPLSFFISSCFCFCSVCFLGGGGGYACVIDEVDSCARGGECHSAGVDGLVRMVTLLEGEPVEAR
jgi:hypothetical protein